MEALLPDHLETIRGIMKRHQIVTDSPGEITWRILSCFCSFPHHCSCFSPQTVTLVEKTEADPDGKSNTSHSAVQPIEDLSEALFGKWCVVEYD
ncbi:hypothetical protein J4Q44_G00316560 [Coregonus suidteri]|uniref:Uncharacterized protein n=1 Tax=Coregonus suidteri TaxID=861788 RepID=A0AAN8L432_9TELE